MTWDPCRRAHLHQYHRRAPHAAKDRRARAAGPRYVRPDMRTDKIAASVPPDFLGSFPPSLPAQRPGVCISRATKGCVHDWWVAGVWGGARAIVASAFHLWLVCAVNVGTD